MEKPREFIEKGQKQPEGGKDLCIRNSGAKVRDPTSLKGNNPCPA